MDKRLPLIEEPGALCQKLAERVRILRLERTWTRDELARRAGVATATLKHFERTGQVALERLVRLAVALDASDGFEGLLTARPQTLAQLEQPMRRRQRGRRQHRARA
jgi:transcriptional regulator with XRE-family HTH domain